MRNTIFKTTLGAIAGLGLLAGNANALLLDFTDGSTEMTNTNYLSSLDETTESSIAINYGSFTVRLTSYINDSQGGDLTFNGSEGPGETHIGTHTFAGDGDGIGINDDEISLGQMLEVTFDPAVKVNEIYFLDLFASEPEYAIATYNIEQDTLVGGSWSESGGVSMGYDGLSQVVTIELSTFDLNKDGISDFSLAGIDVSPVPEPATMLLFGSGLVGIAGLRRKLKK